MKRTKTKEVSGLVRNLRKNEKQEKWKKREKWKTREVEEKWREQPGRMNCVRVVYELYINCI